MTKPRPESELEGLVYGASKLPKEQDEYWYQRPIVWACAVGVMFTILNIIFW